MLNVANELNLGMEDGRRAELYQQMMFTQPTLATLSAATLGVVSNFMVISPIKGREGKGREKKIVDISNKDLLVAGVTQIHYSQKDESAKELG